METGLKPTYLEGKISREIFFSVFLFFTAFIFLSQILGANLISQACSGGYGYDYSYEYGYEYGYENNHCQGSQGNGYGYNRGNSNGRGYGYNHGYGNNQGRGNHGHGYNYGHGYNGNNHGYGYNYGYSYEFKADNAFFELLKKLYSAIVSGLGDLGGRFASLFSFQNKTLEFKSKVKISLDRSSEDLKPGDLFKMEGWPMVFYLSANGRRYTFPNAATFLSWYDDFSRVKTVPQLLIESIPIGGNIMIRPGTKLIKITTYQKVFAVEPGGKLRGLESEGAAASLYGANWRQRVIDLPDTFFINYQISGSALSGYPAGSLVKFGAADDIYYIDLDGKARKFTDATSFYANGFKLRDVINSSASLPPLGEPIAGALAALADPTLAGTLRTPESQLGVELEINKGTTFYSSQRVNLAKPLISRAEINDGKLANYSVLNAVEFGLDYHDLTASKKIDLTFAVDPIYNGRQAHIYNRNKSGESWRFYPAGLIADGKIKISTDAFYQIAVAVVKPLAIIARDHADGQLPQASARFIISGEGISSYRYKLDGGDYQALAPVSRKINLENLGAGFHTLKVTGCDSGVGECQPEESASEYRFKVAKDGVSESEANGQKITTVTAANSEIGISDVLTQASAIVIDKAAHNTKINFYNRATTTPAGKSVTVLAPLYIEAETELGKIHVSLPPELAITAANSGWTGLLNAPTIKNNNTVTINPAGGQTAQVSAVVEVGLDDEKLVMSRAARILIPGQAAKNAGYFRAGNFYPIAAVCAGDTQAAGDNLPAEGDCKIDAGADLVIWTKHFTKFVAYSVAAAPASPISAVIPAVSGGSIWTPPVSYDLPSSSSTTAAAPVKATPPEQPAAGQVAGVKITNSEPKPDSAAEWQQIIKDAEAVVKSGFNLAEFIKYNNKQKDLANQIKYWKNYAQKIKGAEKLSINQLYAINNFVVYGTVSTKKMSREDRIKAVSSYQEAYNRWPVSSGHWTDVVALASGRTPAEKNIKREAKVKAEFKKIYKRNANLKNRADLSAVNLMAYGIKPQERNAAAEAQAAKVFRQVYRRNPKSLADDFIINAVSYSGAKR